MVCRWFQIKTPSEKGTEPQKRTQTTATWIWHDMATQCSGARSFQSFRRKWRFSSSWEQPRCLKRAGPGGSYPSPSGWPDVETNKETPRWAWFCFVFFLCVFWEGLGGFPYLKILLPSGTILLKPTRVGIVPSVFTQLQPFWRTSPYCGLEALGWGWDEMMGDPFPIKRAWNIMGWGYPSSKRCG